MKRTKWLIGSVLAVLLLLVASSGVAPSKAEASSSQWDIAYYSKLNFGGSKVQTKASGINFSWGTKAPIKGIPANKFSAKMTRTYALSSGGKYRLSGKANDGVKIYIDGKKVIDYWKGGSHTFSKDVMLSKGNHKVEVQYYDSTSTAHLTVGLKKVTTLSTTKWTGLFFPSKNFTGTPVSVSANTVNYYWGSKAPHTSIPAGNYSAIFEKKVVVTKDTKYKIMGKANDGVRVYVDGKRQVSYWTPGTRNIEKNITLKKGTHTIKVEYFNEKSTAKLTVDLKESAKVTPLEKWDVSFYNKKDLTGTKVKQIASELEYKWGAEAPASGIPSNNFSARFIKRTNLSSGGTYVLSGGANDGIRIYVNGTKKVDLWKNGTHTFNEEIELDKGITIIQVDYFDSSGDARIQVDLTKKSKKKSVAHRDYEITLSSALQKQMASSTQPQTDKKYGGYIPQSTVKLASTGKTGTVTKLVPIITTSSRELGKLKTNSKVTIKGEKMIDDIEHYEIATGWVNASSADTKHYLNPDTFNDQTGQEYFQYAKLSSFSALNEDEINEKILASKGILKNKAFSYLQAAFKYDVNEIYLISHSTLETGNGTSKLANGIKVKAKTDEEGNFIYKDGEKEIIVLDDDATDYDAKVYNVYGIGAYDSDAIYYGARRAYNEGWTSVSKAIIEGAQFVAENYIDVGQDTLYKMRWNPDSLVELERPSHQYATDIGWAVKQTKYFEQLYSLLDSYKIEYDVPRYE